MLCHGKVKFKKEIFMQKINIAVIGCGSRGRRVVSSFLRAADGKASVCCVYDPSAEAVSIAQGTWQDQEFRIAGSMEEAVSSRDVDMVAIFSPNAFHCEAILAALAHGKKVFSEKPLATTLEDCEKIIAAEKRSGISIMTGFVLRYSPLYRKVKELLAGGTFGKIINISASENRETFGGGASMSSSMGWRRLRSMSGPYLLEKCSHDLDLLNWFAGGVPEKVSAFCGLNFFVPENGYMHDKYDHDIFASLVEEKYRVDPFTSSKDIFDNHSVIMEYASGIRASFQLTLANAIPERRMYISCTEGTIIVECFSGVITYSRLDEPYVTTLKFKGCNTHGSGDEIMAEEVMKAVLEGKSMAVSGSANGLDCARVALAADESALTGKTVSL